MNISYKKIFLLCFLVGILYLSGIYPKPAEAQIAGDKEKFIFSWRVIDKSTAPARFGGKILPNISSVIGASFDLVDSEGSLIDLKEEEVFWYLEGELIAKGKGLQSIQFVPPPVIESINKLRIQISNFKKTGRLILKNFSIPTVLPKVVMYAPFPYLKQTILEKKSVIIQALPYFFSTPSPVIQWEVNGKKPAGSEKDRLILNVPEPEKIGAIHIKVSAHNPNFFLEAASAEKVLSLK